MITICNGTGCQAYGCKSRYGGFPGRGKKAEPGSQSRCQGHRLPRFLRARHAGSGQAQRHFLPEGAAPRMSRKSSLRPSVKATSFSGCSIPTAQPARRSLKSMMCRFTNSRSALSSATTVLIDPTSIDDYLAIGGYTALAKALKMTPEKIIARN